MHLPVHFNFLSPDITTSSISIMPKSGRTSYLGTRGVQRSRSRWPGTGALVPPPRGSLRHRRSCRRTGTSRHQRGGRTSPGRGLEPEGPGTAGLRVRKGESEGARKWQYKTSHHSLPLGPHSCQRQGLPNGAHLTRKVRKCPFHARGLRKRQGIVNRLSNMYPYFSENHTFGPENLC